MEHKEEIKDFKDLTPEELSKVHEVNIQIYKNVSELLKVGAFQVANHQVVTDALAFFANCIKSSEEIIEKLKGAKPELQVVPEEAK